MASNNWSAISRGRFSTSAGVRSGQIDSVCWNAEAWRNSSFAVRCRRWLHEFPIVRPRIDSFDILEPDLITDTRRVAADFFSGAEGQLGLEMAR